MCLVTRKGRSVGAKDETGGARSRFAQEKQVFPSQMLVGLLCVCVCVREHACVSLLYATFLKKIIDEKKNNKSP